MHVVQTEEGHLSPLSLWPQVFSFLAGWDLLSLSDGSFPISSPAFPLLNLLHI